MSNAEAASEEIDLLYVVDSVWKACKKMWYLFPVFAIIGVLAGWLLGFLHEPLYTATATFSVNINSTNQTSDIYNTTMVRQIALTFPNILTSDVLKEKVADQLELDPFTPTIRATAAEESNLFTLSVTDTDAKTAYDVLNTMLELYPDVAQFVLGDTELTRLSNDGMPSTPDPSTLYDYRLVIGAFLGILAALAWASVFALRRKTVMTPEDMQAITSVTNFGSIPLFRFKKRGKNFDDRVLLSNRLLQDTFGENMRTIRHRLEKDMEGYGGKIVLVTSAVPCEGKTMLAANLAESLAHNDQRVILIDCNFHNPSLRSLLKIDRSYRGLHGVIHSSEPVTRAIVQNMKRIEHKNLWVMPADVLHGENSSDLFLEERMELCMRALRTVADYIVLDAPACLSSSDAATLASYADTAVFVVRHDYVTARAVSEGLATLGGSGLNISGYVLNGVMAGLTGSNYGYNSGYYGSYGKYGYGKKYGYGYGKKYGYGYGNRYGYGYGYGNIEDETDKQKKSGKEE